LPVDVVDLRHFLDEQGELVPGRPGRWGAFYAEIAAVGSARPAGVAAATPLRCRRRPGHTPCPGRLWALRREHGVIEWRCPVCDDQGTVSGWEGTRWDLRGVVAELSGPPAEVVLTEADYRTALEALRGEGQAEAVLRAAEPLEEGGLRLRGDAPTLEGVAQRLAAAVVRWSGQAPQTPLRRCLLACEAAIRSLRGEGATVAPPHRPGTPAPRGDPRVPPPAPTGRRPTAAAPQDGRAAARRLPRGGALRPTWVEVDLDRIRDNVHILRARLQAETRLMAVVKADAYGHGAGPVALAALEAGASHLGVALLEEGQALRRAGVAAPVVVLGWTPRERAGEVVAAGLEQAVFDLEDASALAAAARSAGRRVRLHAKVDTGMGRLGWPCRRPEDVDAAADALATVAHLRGVELAGVFTHFADADGETLDSAQAQLVAFRQLLAALEARGVRPALRHCANTAALLRLPESHFDLCRAGIGLYGYRPSRHVPGVELQPALSWFARVAQVRTLRPGEAVSYGGTYVARDSERVATLPVGYADGLSRALSNRGTAWIAGQPAPFRGRVCMDQVVVGVEACGPVAQGDVAVLLGGGHTADALAAEMGTIAYEVLCAISARVPRVYVGR
jgi:alanine racemase